MNKICEVLELKQLELYDDDRRWTKAQYGRIIKRVFFRKYLVELAYYYRSSDRKYKYTTLLQFIIPKKNIRILTEKEIFLLKIAGNKEIEEYRV